MGDDLMAWRLRIGRYRHRAGSRRKSTCTGTFKPRKRSRKRPTTVNHQEAGYSDDSGDRHSFPHKPTSHSHSDTSWMYIMSMCLRACVLLLLVTSMSVEPNPGPRTPSPSRAPDPQRTIGGPSNQSPNLDAVKTSQQILRKQPWNLSPRGTRARSRSAAPGGGGLFGVLKEKKREGKRDYLPAEDKAIVRFLAKHPGKTQGNSWPQPSDIKYWKDMSKYVQNAAKCQKRTVSQLKGRKNALKTTTPSFHNAKVAFGISEQSNPILSPMTPERRTSHGLTYAYKPSTSAQEVAREVTAACDAEVSAIVTLLKTLDPHKYKSLSAELHKQAGKSKVSALGNALFLQMVTTQAEDENCQFDSNPADFAELSAKAMVTLTKNGKPNLVHTFSRVIATKRDGSEEPLIPLHRMPFGLIQHQIEFFGAALYSSGVHMPKDYREWYTLMETEFGTRFSKLFRGPAWSGCPQEDHNKPMKARMNVAAVGHVTVTRDLKESDYTSTIQIQEAALKDLKRTNPEGRFWIKLDATDVKPCIQESVKGKWAGDVDMDDGELQKLRTEYEERVGQLDHPNNTMSFTDDIEFLRSGLNKAVTDYDKHFSDGTTSKQKLISLNWEVVEYSTLLQQALQFQASFTDLEDEPPERVRQVHNGLKVDMRTYLKNLFKKKRTAATHVLVIMLSDERRNTKPYALPVQYLPYRSLKDDKVRVFTSALKKKMVEMNMKCIGTVTDGEFSTLRTSGEDGTYTHISELAKEARQSVSSKGYKTLKQMLIKTGESPDGIVRTKSPTHVPATVLNRLAAMMETLSFSDSLQIIRNELPPSKWDPLDVEEDDLQKMKTIIATYNFRHLVDIHTSQGRDFSKYTYIPGIDPVTNERHHEREDHNHIMKRIASHVRKGNVPDVDFGRWQEAVEAEIITDPILRGKRKQSVGDAERFLSYDVASFFKEKGYEEEARFVLTVARWHDASDGRGLSQEDRSTYNNDMMTMLLSHWIPDYNSESKDLSQIDVNIKPGDVMGFSRETIIGITSNIDSQELRRMENATYGPEHPRAGTTDDVEMFFACLHRITKGMQCTLKEFQYWWQKLIIQFCARLNVDLPFYVWTISDRYSLDDQPSFDVLPDDEVDESGHLLTRLHRLSLRSREKSSVVIGRNTLATQHSTTIRRTQFRRPVPLPSVPTSLNTAAREGATQVLNKD